MTNSGAYPADFQAPESLDGWGTQQVNSWNAYAQQRPSFSPLFLDKRTVTAGKQLEAIREGAQDHELFVMLRARVQTLAAAGVNDGALAAARDLLATAPARALTIIGPEHDSWVVPKDRALLDRLRLDALASLEQLERLPH